MWQYNYNYQSDELYHWGTKGMKWGYNDGRKNGKKTAGEQHQSYEKLALRNAMAMTNAQGNMSIAGHNGNSKQYIKNETLNDTFSSKYKYYLDKEKVSSKLDYKLAFSVGRFIRDSEKSINKGKKMINSLLSKITKNLPKHSKTTKPITTGKYSSTSVLTYH